MNIILKTLFLSCFFSIFAFNSYAQNVKIDSLENLLQQAGHDTTRVNLLNKISQQYGKLSEYEKSLIYAEQALQLAEKNNYISGIAISCGRVAVNYNYQGKYDKALEYSNRSLENHQTAKNKKGIANCLINIGNVHYYKGNYSITIKHYEKALKIQEELGNKFDIARSYNEIGIVHSSLGNYFKAIEYYEKSLKIQEELGNKFDVADVLNNIGQVNLEQGRIEQALLNLEKAWDISSEIGAQSYMARSVFLLGNLYITQDDYTLALQQFDKTLKLHQTLGERGLIARDYIKIGEAYFELENYDEAIINTFKGLKIAKETDRKEDIMLASMVLAKCFAVQKNFEKAYQYQLLYKQTADSIFTSESQKKINALESRFELESKEKEIELQKSQLSLQSTEIEQQQTRQNTLLGGLVAVLIIVVLAITAYLRIRTANKKITELDEFKQGMTGMIVHDLKNPLNVILNRAEKPELKNAGNQMLNMVMNILDVQKFEDTRMILEIRNHSLSDVAERAVEQVSFLSQQKNMIILNSISPRIAVKIDPEIVERIFVNLLTNGIKYSSNNSEINLSVNPENLYKPSKFIRIEVRDTGGGIPDEKLDRVFDKFGQVKAKSSGRIRSTGMGLTFCKLAVEAHAGIIGVDSDNDKGTVFWFTLPKSKPGKKTIIRKSSSIFEKRRYGLTDEDKKNLNPIIQKLKKVEVYEISSLKKILKQFDPSGSDGLRVWKKELLNAIHSGNKDRFKELLENYK